MNAKHDAPTISHYVTTKKFLKSQVTYVLLRYIQILIKMYHVVYPCVNVCVLLQKSAPR
jgi:hypothetical protein